MSGNMYLPFRPPAGGVRRWVGQGAAKCGCSVYQHWGKDDLYPRWQNLTQVRKVATCSASPTIAAADPFSRLDLAYDAATNAPDFDCSTPPATHPQTNGCGKCGKWTIGGPDFEWPPLGAPSEQELTALVDDIIACADPDSTHMTVDKNCYVKLEAEVDNRSCHKSGRSQVLAIKPWHGVLGFKDRSGDNLITSASCTTGLVSGGAGVFTTSNTFQTTPPAVKFRKVAYDGSETMSKAFYDGSPPSDTMKNEIAINAMVGQKTGVQSFSAPTFSLQNTSYSIFTFSKFPDVSLQSTNWNTQVTAFSQFATDLGTVPATAYVANSGNTWSLMSGTDGYYGLAGDVLIESVTLDFLSGVFSRQIMSEQNFITTHGGAHYDSYSVSISNTSLLYEDDIVIDAYLVVGQYIHYEGSVSITLSDAYTSDDLLADSYELLNGWNCSGKHDKLRPDENLAEAPAVCYDGRMVAVAPPAIPLPVIITPGFPQQYWNPPTIVDYSAAAYSLTAGSFVIGDGYLITSVGSTDFTVIGAISNTVGVYFIATGAGTGTGTAEKQRAWIDPNDYLWQTEALPTHGSYFTITPPGGFTGGATLISPLYSGDVIAHGEKGSDRQFFFGANVFKRAPVYEVGTGALLGYEDNIYAHGAQPYAELPPTTLRFLDGLVAQYEGQPASVVPPQSYGVFPYSFISLHNGVLYAQKWVEAKEVWNSVNFGRPYGKDRWLVKQGTVCVSDGTYLRRTTYAADPLDSAGIHDGDYVMVGGDGIYPISAITADGSSSDWSGRAQFTFTLGTKVADIPSGCDIGAPYVGKMRYWNDTPSGDTLTKPPPFGLIPCTAVFDGLNTTFTIPATPYWTPISGGAMTLAVDLYAAMPEGYNCDGNPATAGNPASIAVVGTNVTITKASTGDVTVTAVGNYSAAKWMIPHLHYSGVQFLPEYDDNTPKGDYVQVKWEFDNRSATLATGSQPNWYGGSGAGTGTGIVGCTEGTVTDVSIMLVPAYAAMVGIVPKTGTPAAAVENFNHQNLAVMPSSALVDVNYPALAWMSLLAQAMPDPFWETPFAPDVDDFIIWREDDGTGKLDTTEPVSGHAIKYYPHHPLVEARHTYPANLGWAAADTAPALPADALMQYDLVNTISPTAYPYGIIIPSVPDPATHLSFTGIVGTDAGGWTTYDTAYGFFVAACVNITGAGRFSDVYKEFVRCA